MCRTSFSISDKAIYVSLIGLGLIGIFFAIKITIWVNKNDDFGDGGIAAVVMIWIIALTPFIVGSVIAIQHFVNPEYQDSRRD